MTKLMIVGLIVTAIYAAFCSFVLVGARIYMENGKFVEENPEYIYCSEQELTKIYFATAITIPITLPYIIITLAIRKLLK